MIVAQQTIHIKYQSYFVSIVFAQVCLYGRIRIVSKYYSNLIKSNPFRNHAGSAPVLKIKVVEVLRGRQLAHNSFYFAVLLQRSQPLKFDFVSNGLMAFAVNRQVLLVLVITAEFLSVFFFFSCKASTFTEGTKPHGGCRDFVTKK